MLLSSFKSNRELFMSPFGLPSTWRLSNYAAVFEREPLLLYLRNSFVACAAATVLAVGMSLMASYAFLYPFPWQQACYALLMFGLFMPFSAFMLPYFLIVSWLGLYDSLWGLALVYTGISLPVSFLIVHGYMKDIVNREVLEAAFLDGASFHQTFLKIVVPLCKPGLVTSAIFVILISWNELLFASLLTQSEENRTIQLAIRFLVSTFGANYPQAFAAMIVAIVPMVLLYAVLNTHIVGGLTLTSK